MSSVVSGKNVALELFIVDTYYPVLCATDCTFHVEQELILKTGPNSGNWREKKGRLSQWSASVSGLTKIENTDGQVTFFYMVQESVRLKTQRIRLTFEDDDSNGKQITGDVLIVSNDINGPATDFANCVINFEGTGDFEMDVITPPTPLTSDFYSDYWETVNGNNFIEGASSGTSPAAILFGGPFTLGTTDTILEVDVEGRQFDVITSGTPIGRQCIFNSGTGRITFPSDLIFDGTQKVFVEFKRTI